MKTLIIAIIDGSTSLHDIVWTGFKQFVLKNYDLAICGEEFSTTSPFFKHSKYQWCFPSPKSGDWGELFDQVKSSTGLSVLRNIHCGLDCLPGPEKSSDGAVYLGKFASIESFLAINPSGHHFVYYPSNFRDRRYQEHAYMIKDVKYFLPCPDVISISKPMEWRELLKCRNSWLGGIRGFPIHQGHGAKDIYCFWQIYQHLKPLDYDQIIVTHTNLVHLGDTLINDPSKINVPFPSNFDHFFLPRSHLSFLDLLTDILINGQSLMFDLKKLHDHLTLSDVLMSRSKDITEIYPFFYPISDSGMLIRELGFHILDIDKFEVAHLLDGLRERGLMADVESLRKRFDGREFVVQLRRL